MKHFSLIKMLSVMLALFAAGVGMDAQTDGVRIKGRVVDETGAGIAGAAIVIQDSGTGMMAEADGSFSLTARPGDVLEVSGIGYLTGTVTVTGPDGNLEIVLKDDLLLLDEVVVVGYGSQSKAKLTGAISRTGL